MRQVQIRESVEAMAGSTIVVSNREFEIEGYTVKTSLLDTGTDAVLRQHEGICSTTGHKPKKTLLVEIICLQVCQEGSPNILWISIIIYTPI